MPRHSLPPLFAEARLRLPKDKRPGVVIVISDPETLPTFKEMRDGARDSGADAVPFLFYDIAWYELATEPLAYLCETIETSPKQGEFRFSIFIRHPRRKELTKVDSFSVSTFNELFSDHNPDDKVALRQEVLRLFMQMAHRLWLVVNKPGDISVNTLTRNAPAVFERQGDTLRYVQLEDLRSTAGMSRQRDYTRPDEPSGIRKREHDVRGHWRTYKSGVKVWVKSHQRGDPELGRVTRIIEN